MRTDITVGKFVRRTFDLCARRRPGKAPIFIIDEVGRYVSRSAAKIENLRAVVEQFGKEGKNRAAAGELVAPAWVIVTSQEKLDEVVSAIDSKRIELPHMQDRFKYRIDMAPADIREVATVRVLSKTDDAVPVLRKLYQQNEGQLKAALQLEQTARGGQLTEEDFIRFYPYPPHFIELCIDIMSGLRVASPGVMRQLGGSNRTVIKQAYEMLVSDRTDFASKPVGRLVTLDQVYELVEGNFTTEKAKDISDIERRFEEMGSDGWEARVAKVIALLELVSDMPRTASNIAACLVASVGDQAPSEEVNAALERLEQFNFVGLTEEGWKLRTAVEKDWETKRKRHLEPKPRDRHDIQREMLGKVFGDPRLERYRYRNLKSFQLGLTVDGVQVSSKDGDIPLYVRVAESPDDFADEVDRARQDSRDEQAADRLFWVLSLTSSIDDLVANVYASREMIKEYDVLRGKNKITEQQISCLQNEKSRRDRLESRLRNKLRDAVKQGSGVFRGRAKEGSVFGDSVRDIMRGAFDWVLPELYPRLELGACPLSGSEPGEILKAANLSGLSEVFYDGDRALSLVQKQDQKYVVDPEAEMAKEVLDYLKNEQSYGNRDTRTGKALENRFGGTPYGWDRDVLQVVLAALFRGGHIEVSYQGQRFDSYTDPHSRQPFTKTRPFKSAVFTPVKPIDLKTLTAAVQAYEDITGDTVEVDRNAIAGAFKELADEEMELLGALQATVRAYDLPVGDVLADYETEQRAVLDSSAEECVKMLAGEGRSFKQSRNRVKEIREALAGDSPRRVQEARRVRAQMWPALRDRVEDEQLEDEAEKLSEFLDSEKFYESLYKIQAFADNIRGAYAEHYTDLHQERTTLFDEAIEEVRGAEDWASVPDPMQNAVLSPLLSRACGKAELSDSKTVCRTCGASIGQMESDLQALPAIKAEVLGRVAEIARPDEKIEHVRVADFFSGALDSADSVEQAVQELREHLMKLIDEGVKIILE